MKKLLITSIICSIISTPYIFGMENNALRFPEQFDETFKKITYQQDEYKIVLKNKPFIKAITDTSFSTMVLLELSQNPHKYIFESQPKLARKIINRISRVNKDLYNKLDAQRNDAVTARTMIINIANRYNKTEKHIARSLGTRGAQKCIALSKQLYSPDLTHTTVHQLFKEGALLNYHKSEKPWNLILEQDKQFIDYCIANSTQDERNIGLIFCAENNCHRTIMQQFIDKGANPSIALPYALTEMANLFSDNEFTTGSLFLFLCNAKAYDVRTHGKLNNAIEYLQFLRDCLERNQPLDNEVQTNNT